MGKIAGWKIVKQNTKGVAYEHREPFMSAGSLPGYKTTTVSVSKHTAKTKVDTAARQVGKNKWVYWSYTIEPPAGTDYLPNMGGDCSSKQKALDEIFTWMRKHPRGSPKRRPKKPVPRRCQQGPGRAYAEAMWM